jgi:enoyl-CoA hydratase/carnithine racemase
MPSELQASRLESTLILSLSAYDADYILHPEIVAAAIESLSTADRDHTIQTVILTATDHFFNKKTSFPDSSKTSMDRIISNDASAQGLQLWIDALRDCPKLVIAAVNGEVAGFGISLAMACDLIVVDTSTEFVLNDLQADGFLANDAAQLIAQKLPRQLAIELLVQSKPISATRMLALGLINRVVAEGTALDEAIAWAIELSVLETTTIEKIKLLLKDKALPTIRGNL